MGTCMLYRVGHKLQNLLPSAASRSWVTALLFPPVPPNHPTRRCWGRWIGVAWEEQANTRAVSSATSVDSVSPEMILLTYSDEIWL